MTWQPAAFAIRDARADDLPGVQKLYLEFRNAELTRLSHKSEPSAF
jgi:hypothetical protein